MKDGRNYTALEGNRIVKFDITNGEEVEVLINGNATQPQLEIDDYDFSSDEQKMLIMTERGSVYRRSFVAKYYIYNRASQEIKPLSKDGEQSYATFFARWQVCCFYA